MDGSLSGADRSTASDAQFWDYEDLYRRMDFAVQVCRLPCPPTGKAMIAELFLHGFSLVLKAI